jgi:hypothetical protein
VFGEDLVVILVVEICWGEGSSSSSLGCVYYVQGWGGLGLYYNKI